MLLTPVKVLPTSPEWGFEPKYDGHRLIAYHTPEKTVLRTRGGNNWADNYPSVVHALPDALQDHSAILDGELIGLDAGGNHNLEILHSRPKRIGYCVFDILKLDGEELIGLPLHERRKRLVEVLLPQSDIAVVDMFLGADRLAFVEEVSQRGYEGMVAKDVGSKYHPGIRTKSWRKQMLKRHKGFKRN